MIIQHVCEELADVMNYCILMANKLGVDMEEILLMKLEQNKKKYPVEKCKASSKKYTELINKGMLDVERLQFLDLYSFELRLDYFEKILEFTSSSYSFYWLEAVLNLMIYKDAIEFDEILDEMISLAYEDVVEKGYHLGPLIHQKRTNALENAILSIQKYLPENCSKQEIIICVKQHDEDLKEYKKLLIMQTPYRLLSSFLVDVGGNDPIWNRPKDIIETIKDYNEKYRLPYIIENDRGLKRRVIVQPEWKDFLMTNYRVITEWVHDEKIKYLEKRKIEE